MGVRREAEVGILARSCRPAASERVLAATSCARDLARRRGAAATARARRCRRGMPRPRGRRAPPIRWRARGRWAAPAAGVLTRVESAPDGATPAAERPWLAVGPRTGPAQQPQLRPADRRGPRGRRRRRCRASPAPARGSGGRAAAAAATTGCRPRSGGRVRCRVVIAPAPVSDHERDGGDRRHDDDHQVGGAEDVGDRAVDVLAHVGAVVGDDEDREVRQRQGDGAEHHRVLGDQDRVDRGQQDADRRRRRTASTTVWKRAARSGSTNLPHCQPKYWATL